MWGDVDMFDNVIQNNVFLGLTFAGKTLITEIKRIFTEEIRFTHH